jgi:colanic acid biosynthesis glycosyl transferase WcaI
MRLFIHDYAGHPFAVELSRLLATAGHDVIHGYAGALQTPRGDLSRRPDDPPTFHSRQIKMNPEYTQFKYNFRKRRSMEIAYGKECAEIIREWQPEVVLSANTPTETQEYLLKATKQIGARFVLWIQDFYSIAVDKLVRKKLPLIGRFIGDYYKRMERSQFVSSDHIVTITNDFVPILEKEFGIQRSKVTTISNWAPIESLPVTPKHNPWSEELGLDRHFVFLYSGTLGMKHNPDLLLQLALKYQDVPDVRVLVISEGIGADWLLQKKHALDVKNLHILAYQPFSVLSQVMATGDVLVAVLEVDSGVFSVPSKVLTYLCAQRPILLAVPSVNLAARIIQTNQAGLTVEPADTEGFLAAADQLYTDPSAAEACAQRGRQYAEDHFTLHDIAQRFASVLGLPPLPKKKTAQEPAICG